MYRQGTNPFCTSTREFLYLCMLFDCYVICGLFVGVLDLLYCYSSRARNSYVQKYEFISIINTFCSLFYIILSKNVGICNT